MSVRTILVDHSIISCRAIFDEAKKIPNAVDITWSSSPARWDSPGRFLLSIHTHQSELVEYFYEYKRMQER